MDEDAIQAALVGMSTNGNADGLIPAFNVYLANVPADYYNLVTIRFIEAMDAQDLGDVARQQLANAGEYCALSTFRGIRDSAEWEALIAPMVHDLEDELFAVIAVSNGLGWGNWHVTRLVPGALLELQTCNSYESTGFRELRGISREQPQCFMLAGVSAGVFGLFYGDGSLDERFGAGESKEVSCMCAGDDHCHFVASAF